VVQERFQQVGIVLLVRYIWWTNWTKEVFLLFFFVIRRMVLDVVVVVIFVFTISFPQTSIRESFLYS
jgi:hypothetical protein